MRQLSVIVGVLIGTMGIVLLAGCGGSSSVPEGDADFPSGLVSESSEETAEGLSNLDEGQYDCALDEGEVTTAGVQWLTLKTVTVKQAVYSDKWISLGSYSFPGEPGVYLADNAPEPLSRRVQVGFDAVRFRGSERDVYVDEDKAERGGDPKGWYRATGVGYAGDMLWTCANGGRTDDWMRWKSGLPAGKYEVMVFVPRRNAGTTCATYCLQYKYTNSVSAIEQAKRDALARADNDFRNGYKKEGYCLEVVARRWSRCVTGSLYPRDAVKFFRDRGVFRNAKNGPLEAPIGAWVFWSYPNNGAGHVALRCQVAPGLVHQPANGPVEYTNGQFVFPKGIKYIGYVTWEDVYNTANAL